MSDRSGKTGKTKETSIACKRHFSVQSPVLMNPGFCNPSFACEQWQEFHRFVVKSGPWDAMRWRTPGKMENRSWRLGFGNLR